MKTLEQILDFFTKNLHKVAEHNLSANVHEHFFLDLTTDSRKLNARSIFIALEGNNVDGLDYIVDLAVLTITQKSQGARGRAVTNLINKGYRILEVENLSDILAKLSSWFYDYPSKKLKVIGITGTNGKTSVVHYCANIFQNLGKSVAIIGTLGNGFIGKLEPTENTTPDVVSLHSYLARFLSKGADYVFMEVSSHAISLGRIDSVIFETVALTQVTSDHLDFHKTNSNYIDVKKSLFTKFNSRYKVLNIDDVVGRDIVATLANSATIFTYSKYNNDTASLNNIKFKLSSKGIEGELSFASKTLPYAIKLLAEFNIENILCAVSIALQQGMPYIDTVGILNSIKAVDGRMQVVSDNPLVLVDYAHTEDGLKQALIASRSHLLQGKLWCVFGCGGEKDKYKRVLMGSIANKLADKVILTNDNPRCEDATEIIKHILGNIAFDAGKLESFETRYIELTKKISIMLDRKLAIEKALQQADCNDVILIAGKGHETMQEFCNKKIYFSDKDVVLAYLDKRNTRVLN